MKNTTSLVVIALIVLIGGYFVYINLDSGNSIQNNGPSTSSEAQKITLSMKNYNYYPNTITVNVNQPVEITLDSSVFGCYRAFTIREFGISEYSATPNDKITFTPTKQGTFQFSCSMGMGIGTIIVK